MLDKSIGWLLFVGVVLSGAAIPRDAFAYLDAASGSIMLQAAFAGLFAGMMTLKVYWQRLRMFFVRPAGEAPPERADAP